METKEIFKVLNSLAHLDTDAIYTCDEALEQIDVLSIKDQLTRFRDDHHRHVRELLDAIRRLGGQPPSFSKDFKGFLVQGMTSARSATGTEGALKAMKTNEELTSRNYSEGHQDGPGRHRGAHRAQFERRAAPPRDHPAVDCHRGLGAERRPGLARPRTPPEEGRSRAHSRRGRPSFTSASSSLLSGNSKEMRVPTGASPALLSTLPPSTKAIE